MPRLLACMGALALVASGCGLTIDYVPEDGSPGQDAATAFDGGVAPGDAATDAARDGSPDGANPDQDAGPVCLDEDGDGVTDCDGDCDDGDPTRHPGALAICGDGGFQMNIQELATLRRYQIPVKILLLDNAMLGLVRQWQELFFDGNYSEVDLSDNPDFVEVANAFGIEAFGIERREEVDGAIDRLINARGPILAHVRIDPEENVWPLVPPGASNAEMMEKRNDT